MAPAAVAVLQYSPVHHRLRVSAKKNLEISEIADAGKKSEIEISAALQLNSYSFATAIAIAGVGVRRIARGTAAQPKNLTKHFNAK